MDPGGGDGLGLFGAGRAGNTGSELELWMADQTTASTTPGPSGDDAALPGSPGGAMPPIPDAYTETKFRVLDDVEHVRTRPGMYCGGYYPRGLHHLVYEIVDN